MRFEELQCREEIKKAVSELGFEEATPIQESAIPLIMQGLDIIGQSQTGTGKTAAFGIPVIEKIVASLKKPQALVLCPTRELALQVSTEIQKFLKYILFTELISVRVLARSPYIYLPFISRW